MAEKSVEISEAFVMSQLPSTVRDSYKVVTDREQINNTLKDIPTIGGSRPLPKGTYHFVDVKMAVSKEGQNRFWLVTDDGKLVALGSLRRRAANGDVNYPENLPGDLKSFVDLIIENGIVVTSVESMEFTVWKEGKATSEVESQKVSKWKLL